MQVIKKTKEYTIIKKRSGRYGVRNKHNVWINGEDKSKILVSEGLLSVNKAEVKTENNEKAEKKEESNAPIEASESDQKSTTAQA